MDVSSKYFSLFKYSSFYVVKHLWNFLRSVYQVGKLTELLSFIVWEISHRLHLYRFTNQYIKFTNNLCFSITTENALPAEDFITSSFLAEKGLCFQLVTIDWRCCVETADGIIWGYRYSHLHALYYSNDQSQSATFVYEFTYPITSLFISQSNVIFICSNGVIYRSDDEGSSFNVVLQLSTPISYFLFNNGMTELPDHTLIIGEYGSVWHGKTWQNLAFLYYSADGGATWNTSDFLIRQGVNKHIHLVKYSVRLKAILLTDGDNNKQVWMNTALTHFNKQAGKRKEGWHLINKYHHQTGGYMSMAETNEAVLFGSDYLGGTNFIVKTYDGKRLKKLVLPDPYRRSPIMNMVVWQSPSGNEIWASSYSCLSGDAKSLLMCTKDSGISWERIIDFDGTRNEVRLISSSYNSLNTLYISITKFGSQQEQDCHQIYKLNNTKSELV